MIQDQTQPEMLPSPRRASPRSRACTKVIRHAVALRQEDHLYAVFKVWAAFEEALLQNHPQAERHLADLPPESTPELYRPARTMAELLLNIFHPAAGVPPVNAEAIKAEIKAAFPGTRPFRSPHYVRNCYRRFFKTVRPRVGGDSLLLWSRWFYRGEDWGWAVVLVCIFPFVMLVPPLWIFYFLLFRRFRPK